MYFYSEANSLAGYKTGNELQNLKTPENMKNLLVKQLGQEFVEEVYLRLELHPHEKHSGSYKERSYN